MCHAGVTYGDLYNGNMRFDVNTSVAPEGSDKLGTRTEVKNLNSFRSVERAVEYEIARQTKLLEAGEKVIQETRGWNDATGKTTGQRSKEEAKGLTLLWPTVLSRGWYFPISLCHRSS